MLLEHGADSNRAVAMEPALFTASFRGHVDMVSAAAAGANIDKAKMNGALPCSRPVRGIQRW